ncbi:interferon-induced 35 kDa protein [Centroberyx affinis]|uniref:interferon-induced 35 kDa protein n=1 Tax=Centroberyx affinis TaxID=166261 RepID=UPI003A5BD2BF
MSSDEDFSLMMEPKPLCEENLEGVKKMIISCQMQHDQLLREQQDLIQSRDEQRDLAQQFKQRSDRLLKSLEEDRHTYTENVQSEKEKLVQLKQQDDQLRREIQRAEAAMREMEANNDDLKKQTSVSAAVPEKRVVFMGLTAGTSDTQRFEMTLRVVYPMEGGTALITFEEEIVARKILSLTTHEVNLGGEFSITVEAKPVQLMIPSQVEIDTQVCPRRILISNLPKMDSERLLNKLEIHFSKTPHGGGEVQECDLLQDSGTVVLTFVRTDVAKGLTEMQYHDVEFERGKKKHRVKVTPFLNGTITNLKTEQVVCPRTVLLTGIPSIMEQDSLQDLLEIHFQKSSSGGGEVDAFLYNPLGQQASALFQEDCPSHKGGAL